MCKEDILKELLSYLSSECEGVVLSGDSAVSVCYGGAGVVSKVELMYDCPDTLNKCSGVISAWCSEKNIMWCTKSYGVVFFLPEIDLTLSFTRMSRPQDKTHVQIVDGIRAVKPDIIIRYSCASSLISPHTSSLLYAYKSMNELVSRESKLLVLSVLRSLWGDMTSYLRCRVYDDIFEVEIRSGDTVVCHVPTDVFDYKSYNITSKDYIAMLMAMKSECISNNTSDPFKVTGMFTESPISAYVRLKGLY